MSSAVRRVSNEVNDWHLSAGTRLPSRPMKIENKFQLTRDSTNIATHPWNWSNQQTAFVRETTRVAARGFKREREKSLVQASSLHRALDEGRFKSMEYLLAMKANPNIRDSHQLTPLMRCCYLPQKPQSVRLLRTLLNNGADPTLCDMSGANVLHLAVRTENPRIAAVLLDYNDINLHGKDSFGLTVFHYLAFKTEELAQLVVDAAVRFHISVDVLNDEGLTPLMLACWKGNLPVVRVLIHTGKASLTIKDPKNHRNAKEWLEAYLGRPVTVEEDIFVSSTAPFGGTPALQPLSHPPSRRSSARVIHSSNTARGSICESQASMLDSRQESPSPELLQIGKPASPPPGTPCSIDSQVLRTYAPTLPTLRSGSLSCNYLRQIYGLYTDQLSGVFRQHAYYDASLEQEDDYDLLMDSCASRVSFRQRSAGAGALTVKKKKERARSGRSRGAEESGVSESSSLNASHNSVQFKERFKERRPGPKINTLNDRSQLTPSQE